jgi:hypothetical protein
MDPYLEAHWRDIHARLVIYSCDAIQGVLPDSLRARVEESVLLELPDGFADHPLYPDVRVVERPKKRGAAGKPEPSVAVAEPEIVSVELPPVTETFIEIIDRESGNRVVTVIEFLSPSNKTMGRNRDQYLRKQSEICASNANLVEIDLNRTGMHTLAFPMEALTFGRTPYRASVRRPNKPGQSEVYSMPLEARLLTLKIPLRPEDSDVPLDLQALIDQCYRNGAYEDTLDYASEAIPSLTGPDKEWADELLRKKGLRPGKKPARRKKK